MDAIKNKYHFSLLYEVRNGNPNGDPDEDNRPRQDSMTGHVYTTDMCQKRKVRNFVQSTCGGKDGMGIYVRQGSVLNVMDNEVTKETLGFQALNADEFAKNFAEAVKKRKGEGGQERCQDEMSDMLVKAYCDRFFDIRAFGQVLASTSKAHINASKITGPVVFHYAESVHPVEVIRNTISRCAVVALDAKKTNDLGGKFIVPYALMRVNGSIDPARAAVTGFSEDDVATLFNALMWMHENDCTSARPNQSFRGLYVWKHDCPIGCEHMHKLFDSLTVELKPGVDEARSYDDFEVSVGEPTAPGVTLQKYLP